MKPLMITAFALVLAATLTLLAIAIGTAVKLPKSYVGEWCQTLSMRNGPGEGRTVNYQRLSDCPEGYRVTVDADGSDSGPCRAVKIKKARPPSDHQYDVFYRCRGLTFFLKVTMVLEDDQSLSTVRIMQKGLG